MQVPAGSGVSGTSTWYYVPHVAGRCFWTCELRTNDSSTRYLPVVLEPNQVLVAYLVLLYKYSLLSRLSTMRYLYCIYV